MGKLTQPKNTPYKPGQIVNIAVAAAAKIFAGGLVAINAAGYAVAADNVAGLKVIGRANDTVDNTSGADGALKIDVQRGIFRFANSATKALTRANWNTRVFVEDDNTVASEASNSICAGVMVGLDDEGVWVDTTLAVIPAEAAAE